MCVFVFWVIKAMAATCAGQFLRLSAKARRGDLATLILSNQKAKVSGYSFSVRHASASVFMSKGVFTLLRFNIQDIHKTMPYVLRLPFAMSSAL